MSTTPSNSEAISPKPAPGRASETWRSIHRSWSGRIGLVLASVVIFCALAAPLVAPFQPNKVLFDSVKNEKKLERPCVHLLGCSKAEVQHLMGLDINGRDYFSRIVYGARVSLGISIAAILVGLIIGTLIGLVRLCAAALRIRVSLPPLPMKSGKKESAELFRRELRID